jgi:hypothetical protein
MNKEKSLNYNDGRILEQYEKNLNILRSQIERLPIDFHQTRKELLDRLDSATTAYEQKLWYLIYTRNKK